MAAMVDMDWFTGHPGGLRKANWLLASGMETGASTALDRSKYQNVSRQKE